MSRKKMVRFAENEVNPNVIQAGKAIFEEIKGHWNDTQFQNENPIVVELACGRGEFTVGLGREYRDQNFIGVDIKGSRIWKGSSTAPGPVFCRRRNFGAVDYFSRSISKGRG
jgi:tRNA (guanine-N7-)-methyltransferase